jgi:hypothetical protein
MPLKDGFKKKLYALPKNTVWKRSAISERMDAFLKAHNFNALTNMMKHLKI